MSLYEQTIAEPEATKNADIVDDTAKALANILQTLPAATATVQEDAASNVGNAVTPPINVMDSAASTTDTAQ